MKKVLFAILAVSVGVVLGADEICGAPRVQARAEIVWTKALCKEPGRYIGWPTVCRAQNGELLTVYGRRWGNLGEFACLSDDQGRTWDVKNEIKLAGHWNGDLGYPASV